MNERERRFSASCNFDISEVSDNCNNPDHPNQEAWCHLYNSMCTPAYSLGECLRDGPYKDMLYPISLAETEEMERHLTLAEQSLKVEDERFGSILKEMKSIVYWSKERHFCFSEVALIAFTVFLAFILLVLPKGETKELDSALAGIKTWAIDKDTTYTTEETYYIKGDYFDRFTSPTIFKFYYLHDIGMLIRDNRSIIEFSKDEKEVAKAKRELEENLKEFDRRNALSTKELKEQMIDEFQADIDVQNSITRHYQILYFLLLCLLPLYLLSCFQYGFNISRFIHFRECVHSVCTCGTGVIAFAAGTATIVQTTQYSDGSTQTTRHNPGWIFVLFGLILIVYCSSLAILVLTANGLYYNYFKSKKFIKQTEKIRSRITLFDNVGVEKGSRRYYFNCIMKVVVTDFMNMFTYRGRENRSRYAIFIAANILLMFFFLLLGVNAEIVAILTYVAILPTMARRVHDIGYSAKLIAVIVIPYLVFIVFGLTLVLPGTKGENEYGEEPKSVF
ncbi:MAG: DUF805 domain-containing protein [Paludibacteraceae bacterium]|nr:DUF805 domain-containing protein [Paludibacteraceae bacterium]